MRFGPSSSCMLDECGSLGSPHPAAPACFHAERVRSRYQPSPGVLPGSSARLAASSEFLRSHSRPNPFEIELAARVSSLIATSLEQVHSPRGFPMSSLRSVRRHSQPLDGFLRAPARGPVSSRSRVQGSHGSFRGSDSPSSHPSSSEGVAPLPLAHRPLARLGRNAHGRLASASRLSSASELTSREVGD